jgi:hypothetical protein
VSDILLKAEHQPIFHQAEKLGVGGGTLLTLWQILGPAAIQVILKVLAQYGTGGAPVVGAASPVQVTGSLGALLPFDLPTLKALLVSIVSSHEADIITWLSVEEKALLDMAIQKLSAA